MCLDPVTMIALAATAGGTAMNARANNRYVAEVNKQNRIATQMSEQARQAEQERQNSLTSERGASFLDAASQLDPGKAREKAETDASALLTDLDTRRVAQTAPGWSTGSAGAGEQLAALGNRLVQDKRGQLEAQALLAARGGTFAQAGHTLGRAGARQALLADRMAGSAGVAGQEQRIQPAQVTFQPSLLGDLLLAGGQLGMGMGGRAAGHRQTFGAG